jgi:hypothetical protein
LLGAAATHGGVSGLTRDCAPFFAWGNIPFLELFARG